MPEIVFDCQPANCNASCIGFMHSGGPSNSDPCNDLGGDMSNTPISPGMIDNLFHSIGPKLSRRGHEDYRCFYIQNAGSFTLRNVEIYFAGTGRQVPGERGGSYVAMGVLLSSSIQTIRVTAPTELNEDVDYFDISIPGYDAFKVFYANNITEWTGNFQTAIRAVDGLSEVVVTALGVIPTKLADGPLDVTFTINFGGRDTRDGLIHCQAANHNIPLLTCIPSNGNATINQGIISTGSPVNTFAQTIPDEITPPALIPFDYYFIGNPLRVGSLKPGDNLPIWIRRTLPIVNDFYGPMARSGQMAKLKDNFSIAVNAIYP
jgi:hypothetical protein